MLIPLLDRTKYCTLRRAAASGLWRLAPRKPAPGCLARVLAAAAIGRREGWYHKLFPGRRDEGI